ELERLAQNADKFSVEDRRRLLRRLAGQAQASEMPDLANRFWKQLAATAPENLDVQLTGFDLAMQVNDEDAIKQAKKRIDRIDNDGRGTSARTTQVLYLIWEARQTGNTQRLDEARDLLRTLTREGVVWPKASLVEAIILDLQKNLSGAMAKYAEAIRLGERNPNAIRRLYELYARQGRKKEADDLIKLLPPGTENPKSFQLVEAEVSLQSGKFARAVQLADALVPADAEDYRQQLWRYRVHWMAAKSAEVHANHEEASANYKKA